MRETTNTEQDQIATSTALALKGTGITLLGVLAGIGVTVAFGIETTWWIRVLVGAAVTVALGVLVKLASGSRRGPLARLANWMLGAPNP